MILISNLGSMHTAWKMYYGQCEVTKNWLACYQVQELGVDSPSPWTVFVEITSPESPLKALPSFDKDGEFSFQLQASSTQVVT